MTSSSAPPSSGCVNSTVLLQRQRSAGDCRRWRTVLQITPAQLWLANEMVRLALVLDPAVTWRMTTAAAERPI